MVTFSDPSVGRILVEFCVQLPVSLHWPNVITAGHAASIRQLYSAVRLI